MAVIIVLCIVAPLLTPYDPSAISLARVWSFRTPSTLSAPINRAGLVRAHSVRRQGSIIIGLSGAFGGMILGVIIGSLCGFRRLGGRGVRQDRRAGNLGAAILARAGCLRPFWVRELKTLFTYSCLPVDRHLPAGHGYGFFSSAREESFVEACRAFESKHFHAFKHMLPNCLGPVAVQFTLNTAGFILQEAALSFIGLACRQAW
jgi:peptide/nickel transport system permease protein